MGVTEHRGWDAVVGRTSVLRRLGLWFEFRITPQIAGVK